KIALEQYRNVIGYLQYENTVYWTRSGFMLVAQVALLGFLARAFPTFEEKTGWIGGIVIIGLGVFGLILCYQWNRVNDGALWWINRWHSILLTIEPKAYEDIKVFRGAVDQTEHHTDRRPVKIASKYVLLLFASIWGLSIVVGIVIWCKESKKVDAVVV